MSINQRQWNDYIRKLRAVNNSANRDISDWLLRHNVSQFRNESDYMNALIEYAYAVATKYGEATGELACMMYDLTAEKSGVSLLPAEPAPTATYNETAITVSGARMKGESLIPQSVERLVKLVGEDTTLYNARRDSAQTAWIPSGDTCAFCIMLASAGWRNVPKRRKTAHAEHIHSNCDCAHAVRFDSSSTIGGYDPDEYLAQYNEVGGDINEMRRINYAKNRDTINAQHREAYATRKELEKGE